MIYNVQLTNSYTANIHTINCNNIYDVLFVSLNITQFMLMSTKIVGLKCNATIVFLRYARNIYYCIRLLMEFGFICQSQRKPAKKLYTLRLTKIRIVKRLWTDKNSFRYYYSSFYCVASSTLFQFFYRLQGTLNHNTGRNDV